MAAPLPHVWEVLRARRAAGSQPGQRDDPWHVAVVAEAGGQGGVVNAAYASALQALGMLPHFDSLCGASAGAMAMAHFAAGTVINGTRIYPQFNCDGRFLSKRRLAGGGRPVMDLDYLVDEGFVNYAPLDWDRLRACQVPVTAHVMHRRAGPQAQRLDGLPYVDQREVLKATARVPVVATGWQTRRVDTFDGVYGGGLAMPAEATHGLVLRTRNTTQVADAAWERYGVVPWLWWHDRELAQQVIDGRRLRQAQLDRVYAPRSEQVIEVLAPAQAVAIDCVQPPVLWRAMGAAWRQVFAALGEPEMPSPAEWVAGERWLG